MGRAVFRLKLHGVVRLTAPSGRDVSPRMAKTQALLAYLAMARGEPVHRSVLQDLLWSDRLQGHGRDSLKKALAELRTCLTEDGICPLITNGGPVSLDPQRVVIEMPDTQAGFRLEFLSGLDIRDEAFNAWLLERRLEGTAQQTQHGHPRSALRQSGITATPLFEIGILPPEVAMNLPEHQVLADGVIDRLIDLSLQSAVITCYDFRHQRIVSVDMDRSADVFLRVQVFGRPDRARVRLNLIHQATARVVWTGVTQFDGIDVSDDIDVWAEQVFDESCAALARFGGFAEDEHRAARLTFAAVDRVYRLSNVDIDHAVTLLDEAMQLAPVSTIFAWGAFMTAFQLEKAIGSPRQDLCERARFLSARALEADRHNRLTVALVSHVYSFVLNDLDRAAELLDPFLGAPSQSAMLADTLSVYCHYRGDYAQSAAYAQEAVTRGQFNPFRYSFTTSLAMAQLMLGQHDQAIRSCQTALAQHPLRDGHLYEPTLRTLAAAAGVAGRPTLGRQALSTLSSQAAIDARQFILSSSFRHPNTDFAKHIQKGVGLIHV